MVGVYGTVSRSIVEFTMALDVLLGLKVVVSDVRDFTSSSSTELDAGRLDSELSLILAIISSPLPNIVRPGVDTGKVSVL